MAEAQNPLTPAKITLTDFSVDLATPARALAVGAHPDDVDFGAGASLAKWASQGCEVHILVCTDGSKGTWDPTVDTAELIQTRQSEQIASARALGFSGEIVFLGYPDGELEASMQVREQLSWWIRKLKPNVILGHDPWKRYRLHPDHRNAGLLVCDAVVAARDPLFFSHQSLTHHRPDYLLLWEADCPDHVEDASGWVDAKFNALLEHRSQFESTMLANLTPNTYDITQKAVEELPADLKSFRDRLEAKLAAAGQAAGIDHAELFKLIDDL